MNEPHPPTMHQLMNELNTGRHGHFARKLSEAWFFADSTNQRKIEDTWPHLIEKAKQFMAEPAPVED